MAEDRTRSSQEVKKLARVFARNVADMAAHKEELRELYRFLTKSLRRETRRLKKEGNPKPSGRVKVLAETFNVMSMRRY